MHCSMPRMSTSPTFGIIGLGTMGENLALNLMDHGTPVAVWNLEAEWTDRFAGAHPDVVATKTLAELVRALPRPRRMMMMIKAGAPVDMTMEKLAPLCEPGDVVIDGGNSWFKDTQRREAAWRDKGLHFVGMGVSGGSEGARRGPSLMPGGSKESWEFDSSMTVGGRVVMSWTRRPEFLRMIPEPGMITCAHWPVILLVCAVRSIVDVKSAS